MMKVEDKEQFNYQMKGWKILMSLFIMELLHSALVCEFWNDKGFCRAALATPVLLTTKLLDPGVKPTLFQSRMNLIYYLGDLIF